MSLTERDGPPEEEPQDTAKQLRARAKIGEITEPGQIVELTRLIRDYSGMTRQVAMKALDEVGDRHPSLFASSISALTTTANSSDYDVASIGLRALTKLADTDPESVLPEIDAALTRLNDENPETRTAAFSLLSKLGPYCPEKVDQMEASIQTAIADPDPRVRSGAVLLVGNLAAETHAVSPPLVSSLLDRLDDDHARVRRQAQWAVVTIALHCPQSIAKPEVAVEHLSEFTEEEKAELGLSSSEVNQALTTLASRG